MDVTYGYCQFEPPGPTLTTISCDSRKCEPLTSLYNITGQPAMSVPLHWTDSNIPIGVMFAGSMGDEATLFRLASQLEEAAPWFDRVSRPRRWSH
jgi:Asp-tRNA(Asn)/Glu-tRNA(Gln) amidotransferase A subunit family amidase